MTRLAAYAIFLGSCVVFALGKFPGMEIDSTEVRITFGHYLRAGVPITISTLAVRWLWLIWVE